MKFNDTLKLLLERWFENRTELNKKDYDMLKDLAYLSIKN